MLNIFYSLQELDFDQLMQVYSETNRMNGRLNYKKCNEAQQLLYAEQDFYHYLRTEFFGERTSFYAVLACAERYISALRLEKFKDGLLLEALETAPERRGQGYATMLLRDVLNYAVKNGYSRIYSHVHRHNRASLAVHTACGFTKILDHAVFIDGSVSWDTLTLCCQITD